jgi:hypothetical protein
MQTMHMTWVDWAVVAGVITLFVTMAVIANRLTKSVSGRCAGRFMHAWGGILLQDIILPFRKEAMGTQAHLWALRGSFASVGVIAFVYSLFWSPNQSILMYFAMGNNVWLGPAGAVPPSVD